MPPLRAQLARCTHVADRSLLIGNARTVGIVNVSPQHQLIPMALDGCEWPEHRRDRLVAHLLRHREAVGLGPVHPAMTRRRMRTDRPAKSPNAAPITVTS